jgi:glycosyltransferase 2 family protein
MGAEQLDEHEPAVAATGGVVTVVTPDLARPSGDPVGDRVSRIFASSPDEARQKRPADVALLVVAVLAIALSGWAGEVGGGLERWVQDIVDSAPEWIRSLATAVFATSGMVVLGMLVLVVSRSRWALVRDTLAAVAITIVAALALSRWVSGQWPDVLPELTTSDRRPAFPVVRVAITVAALAIVRPSLTAPVRRFERWVVWALVGSALVLGHATLTSAIGGFALGIAAAAVVRLLFGTSVGIPTLDRVAASLADLNVDATALEYDPEQSHGSLRASGRSPHGALSIRIYGRDAADSAFATRLWRALWYRDAAWSLSVSRRQLAEHEALLSLLAERADVHVPTVVAVGATMTGDVLLVTSDHDDRVPLSALTPADVDDELLDQLWCELGRLHDADLSHGHVDASRVTVAEGGRPGFVDLAGGVMSPTPLQRQIDIVEMLVTTALIVGRERAVGSAVRSCDRGVLVSSLTAIQPVALARELALDVRRSDLDLDALRLSLAEALDIEAPEPVNLRRVRWRDVLMTSLALVAANALIGWVTSIDLDTLVDELATASIGWLLVAFVVSQLTNVAETVSMKGVVTTPLPWGPTLQFQYATSYIGLAVPSDAGRIAMTIRYLQKLGVPTRVAIGQGPFTTVFGYLVDAVLLLVTIRVVGTSLELPEDADFSRFITLLVILAALVVIGIATVLGVPKLRRRILPAVKETVYELKGALTDPNRAAMLLGGIVVRKLLFALTMATILHAFGEPVPIATVIFVNTAVSWFAGIFPVPGGIGVAEAGFVVGLTAFGVSEPVALATALAHRLMTSYLPPVAGFFAMKRLERDGYL